MQYQVGTFEWSGHGWPMRRIQQEREMRSRDAIARKGGVVQPATLAPRTEFAALTPLLRSMEDAGLRGLEPGSMRLTSGNSAVLPESVNGDRQCWEAPVQSREPELSRGGYQSERSEL